MLIVARSDVWPARGILLLPVGDAHQQFLNEDIEGTRDFSTEGTREEEGVGREGSKLTKTKREGATVVPTEKASRAL